jgi:hypothetical protein
MRQRRIAVERFISESWLNAFEVTPALGPMTYVDSEPLKDTKGRMEIKVIAVMKLSCSW